jgi:hypothetical protein
MKATAILGSLERDLSERLQIDLARVAAGEDSLYFYNSDHNPFRIPESKLSRRGAEAYQLAQEIRRLRTEIGESHMHDAGLFIEAVEQHADQENPHRLGAKRLAAKLATDLERARELANKALNPTGLRPTG